MKEKDYASRNRDVEDIELKKHTFSRDTFGKRTITRNSNKNEESIQSYDRPPRIPSRQKSSGRAKGKFSMMKER